MPTDRPSPGAPPRVLAPPPEPPDAPLERHLRLESALLDVSRWLLGRGEADLGAVLGRVGEATGARHAYLAVIDPSGATGRTITWQRPAPGEAVDVRRAIRAEDPARQAVVVGVLSARDELYGHLGFEYEAGTRRWATADQRALDVLGSLLAAYFERTFAERALEAREARHRAFVEAISEGILFLAIDPPLDPSASAEAQAERLLGGRVDECNRVMAEFLGHRSADVLVGHALGPLAPRLDASLVRAFVDGGYHLHHREHVTPLADGSTRHFLINAVGLRAGGRLTGVWVTSNEVTERVALERKTVALLEAQQQRLGQDLHDGVGQLLTGIRMLSQSLADRAAPGERLPGRIAAYAEQATDRIREIYRGLTPVQLFAEGLAVALDQLAEATGALPGVACTFEHETDAEENGRAGALGHESMLHLYRVAQESTNNALKHARARHIRIALRERAGTAELEVRDDGRGFDVEAAREASLGLSSMRYRAQALGGRLDLASAPGTGTVVRCTVPQR